MFCLLDLTQQSKRIRFIFHASVVLCALLGLSLIESTSQQAIGQPAAIAEIAEETAAETAATPSVAPEAKAELSEKSPAKKTNTPPMGEPSKLPTKEVKKEPIPNETLTKETLPKKRPFIEPEINADFPNIFLVPDKDGKLQTVLGFKYEELLKLWRMQNGLVAGGQKPRFDIASMEIKAKELDSNQVELALSLQIDLRTDRPVEVPLGLGSAVLLDVTYDPKSKGDFVHFDEKKKRWVAWIQAKDGERRTLKLKVAKKLEKIDLAKRLALAFPKATVSSFSLTTDKKIQSPRSQTGLAELKTLAVGKMQINVQGVSGEFALSWEEVQRTVDQSAPILKSTGEIFTTINRQGITSKAKLTIESLNGVNGAFDHCRVRLPKGTRLQSAGEGEYSWLQWVDPKQDPEKIVPEDQQQLIYEFRWSKPQTKPVDLIITTDQPIPTMDDAVSIDIGHFEVLNAVQQSGYVALKVDRKWRPEWKANSDMQAVAALPDALATQQPFVGFEYFRRTWSLKVILHRRPPQLRMGIEQWLVIDRSEVQWHGKVNCFAEGSPLFAIRLKKNGWSLDVDKIGPKSLLDTSGNVEDVNGIVTIPLRKAMTGNIEINLVATKERVQGEKNLQVSFPVLQHDDVIPGKLVVVSPSSVEVRTRTDEISGLVPLVPMPEKVALPAQVQIWKPRFQVFSTFLQTPSYSADVVDFSRSMQMQSETEITVENQRAHIVQNLDWFVRYEPIQQLRLELPAEWIGSSGVRVLLDGEETFFSSIQKLPDSIEVSPSRRLVEIRLDEPRVGRIPVQIIREQALSISDTKHEELLRVPLAMLPADAELRHSRVKVVAKGLLIASVDTSEDDAEWELDDDVAEIAPNELRLVSSLTPKALPLHVRMRPVVSKPLAVVDRTWIRSEWDGQKLRTTYHFSMQATSTAIQFAIDEQDIATAITTKKTSPETSGSQKVLDRQGAFARGLKVVRLDGEIVQPELLPSGLLSISIDPTTLDRTHQLEILIEQDSLLLNNGVKFQPIQLQGNIVYGKTYWELVVPRTVHLLSSDSIWAVAHRWQWKGLGFQRQPVLDDNQLARWVGAEAEQDSLNSTENRVYLFSKNGMPKVFEATIVRRSMVVLLGSGSALLAGLLLLYIPFLRRASVLCVAFATVAAAGLLYPGLSILLLQASFLGVLLSGLAVFLQKRRVTTVRVRPAVSVHGSTATQVPENGLPYSPYSPTDSESISIDAPTVSMQATQPKQ